MAEDILAALQRGKYEGRSAEVSDYLVGKVTSKAAPTPKHQCLYAIKFLYHYTTEFDKLPESEITGVLKAVEDCCAFIQRNSNNVKDSQTAEKLLYHILSKAVKKSYHIESIRLAKCMSAFLYTNNRQDDATVQKIGHSTFSALWNGAVETEKRNPNADSELCLQLRHQAMVHLLRSGRVAERYKDVVTWTIDHYSRVVSKLKVDTAGAEKACGHMEDMVQDLSEAIQSWLGRTVSDEDECIYVLMYLQVQLRLLTFLFTHHGSKLCDTVLDRLIVFLSRLNVKKLDKGLSKVHTAILQIIQAGVYLRTYTSSGGSGVKQSQTETVRTVEKANTQLTLICKQVKDLLPMSLLHHAVRFSLQLPDDTSTSVSKISRFDFQKMPDKVEKAVLELHGTAGKFYESACQTVVGLGDGKLVTGVLMSHVKVLQYKLSAVATKLDTRKDVKGPGLEEELAAVYLDLSRLEAAITARSATDTKSATDDLYQLASISYKFGRLCFFRSLHSQAVGFLRACVSQSKQWQTDSTSDTTAPVSLWRKYEMLADAQRNAGQVEAALETVAEGVVSEPEHLSQAAERWVRIKGDAFRYKARCTNVRSLWSYIKDKKTSLSAHQVLTAEFSVYKKYRSMRHMLQWAVLEELLEVTTSDPMHHAPVLLEKAALLWEFGRRDAATTPEACCKEAISELEGVLTNQNTPCPLVQNVLARAYLWCHVVTDIDPEQLREELTERSKSATADKTDPTLEVEPEDNEAYHDCCTIDMERHANKMVDRALELWEGAVVNGNLHEILDKPDVKETIDCLSVLTDVYKLSHRMPEEFRALTVLDRLSSRKDHPVSHLRTQTDLIDLYTRMHQPQLAAPLVEAALGWLQEAPWECTSTVQQVEILLAAAEALLLNGQVNRGCEVLNKAINIKTKTFKPKSTDALTLDARINRLIAAILTLPPSCHGDDHSNCVLGHNAENALELEVRGTRSISGVVCFLLGGWLVSRKKTTEEVPRVTLNKWVLLDTLLTSFYYTGATCVLLGEAQEARCYLQQGLKVAQGFNLPRRFAAFHLELSKLDNLSAKFTDSQSHINVAYYTLNSTDPAPRPTTQNHKSATQKPAASPADESDDDMVMKMRPMEMSEMLEEEDVNASHNVIGSPVSRRWKPRAPASWSHAADCECSQCRDVVGQGLQLQHLAQQAYCLFQQGLNTQAEAFWNLLLHNFDAVTNRARRTILKLVTDKNSQQDGINKANTGKTSAMKKPQKSKVKTETVVYEDPSISPSVYQRLLVDVCQHLTEQAIVQQNWELYDDWVCKAQELLAMDKYPWMLPCQQNLAEILYLRVVPSLPLPKVDEKSDLQELCERIGRVKVGQFNLDETDQPGNREENETVQPQPNLTGTPSTVEASLSKVKPETDKKLKPKRTGGRSSKLASQSSVTPAVSNPREKPASAAPVAAARKVSKAVEVSPLIHQGEDASASVKRTSYKTPLRKMRLSKSQVAPAPGDVPSIMKDKGLDKSYLPMFKTPKSVSGRRAVLDLLINSDSDEEILPKSTKTSIRKKLSSTSTKGDLSARRTGQRKTEGVANKALATPKVQFDVLSPSGGNNKVNSQRAVRDGKQLLDPMQYKTPSKVRSPVTTLFKATLNRSVAMEMGSENVFDFIPSSPEETPVAARGKKKPGKPGRKAAPVKVRKTGQKATNEPDIEVKRVAGECPTNHFVPSEVLVACDPDVQEGLNSSTSGVGSLRTKTKNPLLTVSHCELSVPSDRNNSLQKSMEEVPERETMGKRRTQRTSSVKLTRSKTSVLETNREGDSSDEDSLSISLNDSAFMPESEEPSSPEKSACLPSPERQVEEQELHALKPTSESQPDDPLSFLVPPTSPIEIMRHASERSFTYLPAFETVEEEEEEQNLSVLLERSIPQSWLEEPIEVPRGWDSDEDGSKDAKVKKKLQPKRAGRVRKQEVVTEVPRLSTITASPQTFKEVAAPKKKVDKKAEEPRHKTVPMNPVSDLSSRLDQALSLLSHNPPPIPYRKICHAKVLVELNEQKPDQWLLAYYLTESHSVSFRHNAIANICRKIKKLADSGDCGAASTAQLKRLQLMQTGLRFGQTITDLKPKVDQLPKDWTVVQVSVLTTVGEPRGRLVLSRFIAGNEPIIVQLPGFATTQGHKLLDDYASLLKSNYSTMGLTNKVEWWSQRHALNEKLKEVLEDMENRWLGPWVGLLQGRPDNEDDSTRLDQAAEQLTTSLEQLTKTPVDAQLVKLLLRSHHLLEDRHVTRMSCDLCHVTPDDDVMLNVVSKVNTSAKSLNLAVTMRSRPVLLILDKAVQHLPWESLPSIRGQPLSRVPSLHFLDAHLGSLQADATSVFNTGVDQSKTYYVLNPDDNLDTTQTTFAAKFKDEKGWKGVVGKPPTSAQYTEAVTEHDLFIYCGHGSGSKFLPGGSLALLQCRAAVLLMGCSSGKLAVDGQLEAAGMMLNYFLAGCPCIVACLWDVTDRDIDRFLEELLSRWKVAGPGTSLLDCVHQSRDVCRLPYLIGAAPAVYGLPVSLNTAL